MDGDEHDRLTPRELEAVNRELIRYAEADPDNWRQDADGRRYYDGPRSNGDGTIDWPRTNEHGNVIDYGPQFDERE